MARAHSAESASFCPHVAGVGEHARHQGVAGGGVGLALTQRIDCHGLRQFTGAQDLHAVVEEPYLGAPVLQLVVPVSDGN